MTRNEVIKGLECCMIPGKGGCDDCPYIGKGVCQELLGEDALALLKTQEPRVMTLEEVSILGQDVVVWYEHIGVNPPRPRIVHHADNLGIVFTDGGVWLFTEDDYGRKWRCWTSRPTDEQREATPWN